MAGWLHCSLFGRLNAPLPRLTVAAACAVAAMLLAAGPAFSATPGSLAIVAGTNRALADGPATAAPLVGSTMAVDGSGNLYVADTNNSVVAKITPSGTQSIVAGIPGERGLPPPGPASASDLAAPSSVAVDGSGNLYIADSANSLVEEVTPSGTLSIIAGTVGLPGASSPGSATHSHLNFPEGVAVDGTGNVYIADTNNDVVEKLTPTGTLSIVAGVEGTRGPPTAGPATASDLDHPQGVAVDGSENVYIADTNNDVVEKVTPSGALSIFAGTALLPAAPAPGPATSSGLNLPEAVAVDGSGNVYVADTFNDVVEKITPSGTLSIAAGNGSFGRPAPGPATASPLARPSGVAADGSGDLYIADAFNTVIEKVTPAGALSVFAGVFGYGPPTPGPAAASALSYPLAGSSDLSGPAGVAVDSSGDLYIADAGNDVVEKVTPSGTLSIFAGRVGQTGLPTSGAATSSDLGAPYGVALDASGDLYSIADAANSLIEKVTPSGSLSIVAGIPGHSGAPTPGLATNSDLDGPLGVAVDGSNNLYIADAANNRIEKVTPSGTLSVVAGNGQSGVPTPGLATASDLAGPAGVAVDGSGNVYVADTNNSLVEKVTPSGTLSIFAGMLFFGFGEFGPPTPGPASASTLGLPAGLAFDGAGDLYIADAGSSVVAKVDPSGTLSVIAGTAGQGPPTPGPGIASDVNMPSGVAADSAGDLYIADRDNSDVEEVFDAQAVTGMHATTTTVACAPASVTPGSATTCTATVTDIQSRGASTPTGSIGFVAGPTTGSFSNSGVCPLVATSTFGVASCAVTFTPSAAGSYGIGASYAGDGAHLGSNDFASPASVTAANPPPLDASPPGLGSSSGGGSSPGGGGPTGTKSSSGPGSPSTGDASVSGTTVAVPVTCTGAGTCTVTLTLTVVETLQHGKVTAVTASAKPKKPKKTKKTVVVGTRTATIAPGATTSLSVGLNQAGTRLLAKHNPLTAKLTVTSAGKTLGIYTLPFNAKKKHRKAKK